MAIYARGHWMGERGRKLEALRRREIDLRLNRKITDGSIGKTIETLFDLWLLETLHRPETGPALDFLMDRHTGRFLHSMTANDSRLFDHIDSAQTSDLQTISLPFQRGEAKQLKTTAALFFATLAGRDKDTDTIQAYEALDMISEQRGGFWSARETLGNAIAAYAVHPKFSNGKVLKKALKKLASEQKSDGRWNRPYRFLPLCWALSFLDNRSSMTMLRHATPAIMRAQRKDGSWGRSLRELNTFMAISVLKRTGALP